MRRIYAYKVVRGELRFESSEDEEKILRLMEVWRKSINDIEHRDWHLSALPNHLQRTAKEHVEEQRKSMRAKGVNGEPVLHAWTIQLDRQNARFSDDKFRKVSLTTLEPYRTVEAEFRSRRWRLLKEALSSPIREGCKKHHVLEVCNPKLTYDEHDRKLCLIYVVRKLVEIPGLEDFEKLLDEGFNVVSVDLNLDDVTYAVFHISNAKPKRLHIDRCRWGVGEWMRVRRIDAFAQKHHGTSESTASTHWMRLKRTATAKAGEAANEVVNTAKKFDAKAIVHEKFSDRFPKKSRDYNYKIHMWYRGRIIDYLRNNGAWHGVPAFWVPARGTSSRCSRCNAKLPNSNSKSHRDWQTRRCKTCGFADDRDHIACTNIANKFIRKLLKLRLRHILQMA